MKEIRRASKLKSGINNLKSYLWYMLHIIRLDDFISFFSQKC